jgi:hypothetical protein
MKPEFASYRSDGASTPSGHDCFGQEFFLTALTGFAVQGRIYNLMVASMGPSAS